MVMSMEDIILEFWQCSLRRDFSDFDWDEAFEQYEPHLERIVAEHGLNGVDRLRENLEDFYGDLENDIPAWATPQTDWIWVNKYDAVDALIEFLESRLKAVFECGVHGDLKDLLERINDRRGLTEPELIQLFDECIHAAHVNGDVLEDINVDDLRQQAEDEWKEEQEKFPTNIREFLGGDDG